MYGQRKQKGVKMNEVNIEQCVQYFTQGSWGEWIGGGLIVVTTLVGTFTKWNIPSFLSKIVKGLKKK